MIAASYQTVKDNFAEYFDKAACANETVLVKRRGTKDAVLLSREYFE